MWAHIPESCLSRPAEADWTAESAWLIPALAQSVMWRTTLRPAPFWLSLLETGGWTTRPVWTDARTFDGKPWRGVVDILVAGYPCQPFSQSGKRRGASDERNLWPAVLRIVSECQPSAVFLENVEGHLRLGYFDAVEPDLARAGYTGPASAPRLCFGSGRTSQAKPDIRPQASGRVQQQWMERGPSLRNGGGRGRMCRRSRASGTCTCREWRSGIGRRQRNPVRKSGRLDREIGSGNGLRDGSPIYYRLNPSFVEWIMGWEHGATSLRRIG